MAKNFPIYCVCEILTHMHKGMYSHNKDEPLCRNKTRREMDREGRMEERRGTGGERKDGNGE